MLQLSISLSVYLDTEQLKSRLEVKMYVICICSIPRF